MISAATQQLFADIFERSDLFAGFHPIHRRKVAWGSGAPLHELPHVAVVADEPTLLDRLGFNLGPSNAPADAWLIRTSREETAPLHFGDRIAHAARVALEPDADPLACVMESVAEGWLFQVPTSASEAYLLAVGADPESLLAASRFVAPSIAHTGSFSARFPSHPRVSWPLCGPKWLACGTGALAFDPICGDGSGNAIREAILAAAVIRAASGGEDPDRLADHYRTRLLLGFQRHLQMCEQFYASGGDTAWWTSQRAALRQGIGWCRRELGPAPRFGYRLDGFVLTSAPY